MPDQELPRTPRKGILLMQNLEEKANQDKKSGAKQESSYIPLHERYQYILESQKDNLRKLVTE